MRRRLAGLGPRVGEPGAARTCEELGIIFVGPTDRSMFLLGDKIASTIIAQSAEVPCVSWSGTGVTVEKSADGKIDVDDETFLKCCVTSAEEALSVAEKVGYPIMIKASEGGGGKGVRKALSGADIPSMYQQVADEVKGSPIFLMRLCNGARHVEIQVLADKHKNVAILSGRDCSMQRRFQKIVEEGPPIAVGPDTMKQMELAAAKLALMVDYTHAGTVEYLFIEETGAFYFLELNPRLQVEHPVTEGITGMNIPSLQLMVAMGVDITKVRARAHSSLSSHNSLPTRPHSYTHPPSSQILLSSQIDGTMDSPMKPIMPYIVDVTNPSPANPSRRPTATSSPSASPPRTQATAGSRRSARSTRLTSSRSLVSGATSPSVCRMPRSTRTPTRNSATCSPMRRRALRRRTSFSSP